MVNVANDWLLKRALPCGLGELVVGFVFVVGIEVKDALYEVLGEHGRVLQQEVNQAVLTQPGGEKLPSDSTGTLHTRGQPWVYWHTRGQPWFYCYTAHER